MNHPRLEWLLSIVEEKGISKAASKLYVSQQSVSAYVKRLEQYYGATLFHRSEGFSLTSQGMLLYRYAQQVLGREELLRQKFEEIRSNQAGRIRFGISMARSQIFLPKIIPAYRQQYPAVEIVLLEEATTVLAKRLNERSVDLYLGKDLNVPPYVEKEVLCHERLFVLVTDQLLEKYWKGSVEKTMERFRRGVHLKELQPLPFIAVNPAGKVHRYVENYCGEKGIQLNYVLQVNQTPLLIELCRTGLGAGLCLETFLPQVLQYSRTDETGTLNIVPILDQISDWKIIMACYADEDRPVYFRDFQMLARNAVYQR